MTILVSGGAASGKSAFAERLALSLSDWACGCADCNRSPRCNRTLLYIATMEPYGTEAAARIARHRSQRREKGFVTVERYTDLAGLAVVPSDAAAPADTEGLSENAVPLDSTVLLEDLGNLCANELYSPNGSGYSRTDGSTNGWSCGSGDGGDGGSGYGSTTETAAASILRGIENLRTVCRHVVIVTNEVFSGGADYAGDTDRWLRLLADVNRRTAARSDGVCEVTCGVPCWYRFPGGDVPPLPDIFREGTRFREVRLHAHT